MVTYDNYYRINKESEPTKYRIIKEKYIDVMLGYLAEFGSGDAKAIDYADCARNYDKLLKTRI